MDEVASAQGNPHVSGRPATAAEKDEVALARLLVLPEAARRALLLFGVTRKRHALFGEHLLRKAGAIEAERRPSAS